MPKPPKNWKKPSGKELTLKAIKSGKAKMAFEYYAREFMGYLSGEMRLALAINGLGERSYLLKKRGEVLKTLARSARYHIIKVTAEQLTDESKEVIKRLRIPCLKKDYPADESGNKSFSLLCRNEEEYWAITQALVQR